MRVAVLVKQVPKPETLALGPDGRLVRDEVETEMNAYCRRAVAKGVELAAAGGGSCTVITLGPAEAEDVLREAIACGADHGVHVCGREFAGSDTLATARALEAAVRHTGPYDLVLVGRNSVDADTGQVGPELAELLDLPFLGGVRSLSLAGDCIHASCELDDGTIDAVVSIPAVLSVAERLCEPAKAPGEARRAVAADRIERLGAQDLGSGPWGQAGSPTRVGAIRLVEHPRHKIVLAGPVEDQVRRAVALLAELGALTGLRPRAVAPRVVPDDWERGTRSVAVVLEAGYERAGAELLGAAAELARAIAGRVLVVVPDQMPTAGLAAQGADDLLVLTGADRPEDLAAAVVHTCSRRPPWALLVAGTMVGREVASRVAARLGCGLIGDAIELEVEAGRLVGWKPAFGGALVAAITSDSVTQVVTLRPGVLPVPVPRSDRETSVERIAVNPLGRVVFGARERDDAVGKLVAARTVIGVGQVVDPSEYDVLEPLRGWLGAELAATRKVTDLGWLPRGRQVGITGHSIAPDLYIAVGISGRFNHVVGVRGAGTVLAINPDSSAPIREVADIVMTADWRAVVPALHAELERAEPNLNLEFTQALD
jgi:electron transfer flavoprotein alpha subunit